MGAAIVGGFVIHLSLDRRVQDVIEETRTEALEVSPGAELVGEMDFYAPAPDGVQSFFRLLPAADMVSWNERLVLATGGGLLIYKDGVRLHLSSLNGLPGTEVTCLATWLDQLLVGTTDGLAILDEKTVRSYRFADAKANHISCLLSTDSGVLIGTQGGGLLHYDGSSIGYHPALRDARELMVSALSFRDDGFAVGTWRSGVFFIDDSSIVGGVRGQGLIDPVTALLETDSNLLIGSPVALQALKADGGLSVIMPDVNVSSMLLGDGAIWIAAGSDGVITLDGEDMTFSPARDEIMNVRSVGGEVYALGVGGVSRVTEEGLEPLPEYVSSQDQELVDNHLTSLAAAPPDKLWIGTFEKGVQTIESFGDGGEAFLEPDFGAVNRVVPNVADGKIYVATNRGALVYSSGVLIDAVTREDGLIGEAVFDVLPLAGGEVAYATNKGVTIQGAGGFRSLYAFHGLVNNHVYCLAEFQGKIAAGTLGGLSFIEDDRVIKSYTMDDSPLRHNWINALVASPETLYVGSFGGGVVALTGEMEWLDLSGPMDKANVNPHALLLEADRLYAGVFGQGLYSLNLESGKWSACRGPLPSRNVTGLARWTGVGGRESLAIATDAGLIMAGPGYVE